VAGLPSFLMRCPYCATNSTRVVDSRPSGPVVRRRRECSTCGNRFTTYERAEVMLSVRKRDGRIEPFEPAKIRAGLQRALADRPVTPATVDRVVAWIEAQGAESGPQLDSDTIGRLVLDQLKELDESAYLRFASVYKDFEGAKDFEREMAQLGDRS